jgi:hypothetical protein
MTSLPLLAIDPGKTTGWALYYEKRLHRFDKLTDAQILTGGLHKYLPPLVDIVIERPVFRRNHPRQENILTLAMLAGQIGAVYGLERTHYVKPEQWKKQLPKGVCWARALGRLDADERALLHPAIVRSAKKLDHNIADAIAIGLWALGRF